MVVTGTGRSVGSASPIVTTRTSWPRSRRNRAKSGPCVAGPPTSGGQIPVRRTTRIGLSYGGVVSLKHTAAWRELRSPRFALLLVTLAFCLVRARDQPGLDVGFGST